MLLDAKMYIKGVMLVEISGADDFDAIFTIIIREATNVVVNA